MIGSSTCGRSITFTDISSSHGCTDSSLIQLLFYHPLSCNSSEWCAVHFAGCTDFVFITQRYNRAAADNIHIPRKSGHQQVRRRQFTAQPNARTAHHLLSPQWHNTLTHAIISMDVRASTLDRRLVVTPIELEVQHHNRLRRYLRRYIRRLEG